MSQNISVPLHCQKQKVATIVETHILLIINYCLNMAKDLTADEEKGLLDKAWSNLYAMLRERCRVKLKNCDLVDSDRIGEIRDTINVLVDFWAADLCKAITRYLRTGERVDYYDSKLMRRMQEKVIRLI